ncbi:hypothetical protein [Nonomuraea sp. NPDC001023]|uniref:hypothetical protein n=1 Tax=unclassified Nonomuraea TaxID=2593643 RepID=UPI0033226FB7
MERGGLAAAPEAGDAPDAGEPDFGPFDQGVGAMFALPTTKLFVTLLVEALEPGSPIRDRYVEIHDTLRDHCRRWLERLPLPPGLPVEPLAVALIGAGIGIHQQWLVAPERVDAGAALAALRALVAGALPPAHD